MIPRPQPLRPVTPTLDYLVRWIGYLMRLLAFLIIVVIVTKFLEWVLRLAMLIFLLLFGTIGIILRLARPILEP